MPLADQAVHLLVFLRELFAVALVFELVVRADELGGRSKDIRHRPLVVFLNGKEEGAACFLG